MQTKTPGKKRYVLTIIDDYSRYTEVYHIPYKLCNSRIPDVSNLHVFGCVAYAHIPNENRRKLNGKAKKLIFVGNSLSDKSKAFRLLDTETDHIKISRSDIFLDSVCEETQNNIFYENVISLPTRSITEDNEEIRSTDED